MDDRNYQEYLDSQELLDYREYQADYEALEAQEPRAQESKPRRETQTTFEAVIDHEEEKRKQATGMTAGYAVMILGIAGASGLFTMGRNILGTLAMLAAVAGGISVTRGLR